MWIQKEIKLPAVSRGFHLISRHIVDEIPELKKMQVGLAHLFIQHTSASLAINENADPDVRHDMEAYFSRAVAENEPYYRHTLEGDDDMPAHIKSVLLGTGLTIPIRAGRLALGAWQGIYLCEHRNRAGGRTLIVTLNGQ
ncbi:secondary thiamine-phosphate synthase enzyme YjbQ [Methylomarinum sp. Ch1-1]|uniref:Secondary thiamine-phosphate synthase enzyme YjbQ n=1 Tax=Methylomarinum roseum TaxID=3067653 RepID=A0AAU7NXW6_9GAMM|nr:secondary thiamine-phosphate synthase enzyme YjbQ [Methylomarinum sp. Ch1-1]MDP4522123.1 secondary thiamine-phosphate synthase enzyme YjbQ [Methylomarinum sp. Ch1-1]